MPRLPVIAAFILSFSPAALAQSSPRYLPLGPADAALYTPDSGPAPHLGVLVIHRTADYLRHPACTELSRRGLEVQSSANSLDIKDPDGFRIQLGGKDQ